MLIRDADLRRIATGAVTVAFRRWRSPTVKTGGSLKTSIGVLAIESGLTESLEVGYRLSPRGRTVLSRR